MIPAPLSMLRLALWPNLRSILENLACALEKNVPPTAVGGVFCTDLLGLAGIWFYYNLPFPFHLLSNCSTDLP